MPDEQTFVEGDKIRVKRDINFIDRNLWGREGVVEKWYHNDMYRVRVIIFGVSRQKVLRATEMEKINA